MIVEKGGWASEKLECMNHIIDPLVENLYFCLVFPLVIPMKWEIVLEVNLEEF